MSYQEGRRVNDAEQTAQIEALLSGQVQLARQMAEMVISHQDIVRRHEEDAQRFARIESALAANNSMTADVREMMGTVTALKGGLKVMGWIGVGAKWFTAMAAAVAAVWVLIQFIINGGNVPPNLK